MKQAPKLLSGMAVWTMAVLALSGVSAEADVLYSNGAVNGYENGFTINLSAGYGVSDSFALTNASNYLTQVDVALWALSAAGNVPTDVPATVDWAITSAPFAGTTYASGTGALSGTDTGSNGSGFDVFTDSFGISTGNLAAGTYYLQLSDATVTAANGDAVYWDENDGSSAAYQANEPATGTFTNVTSLLNYSTPNASNSETFAIEGSSTPEPGTVTTLLGGLLFLGPAMYRSRRKVQRTRRLPFVCTTPVPAPLRDVRPDGVNVNRI